MAEKVSEKMTAGEKKFTIILASLALIAIIIVILVYVPVGGDRSKIRREFGNLDKKHVFESISYDEVIEKINKGETFQLFIGSSFTVSDKSFAYEANQLAKEYNVEKIYYLRLYKLTNIQISNLKAETSVYVEFHSLFYFEYDEDLNKSYAYNISGLKNPSEYGNNWQLLLDQYFQECYKK